MKKIFLIVVSCFAAISNASTLSCESHLGVAIPETKLKEVQINGVGFINLGNDFGYTLIATADEASSIITFKVSRVPSGTGAFSTRGYKYVNFQFTGSYGYPVYDYQCEIN